MTAGLLAVQARITELQALLAPAPKAPAQAAQAASSSAFADAMAQVNGGLPGGGVPASGDLGNKVVDLARNYLGIPYKWGGTDPKTGLDCSGLTQLVYKQVGVDLPRVSRDQAKVGTAVASVAEAKPGDLVFFDSPVDHVGIYVGNNKILHAPRTGRDVSIDTIWEKPSHIRRVLPQSPVSGIAGAGAIGGASAIGGAVAAANTAGGVSGPYANLFNAAGRKHGVDPALLSAVAKAESSYNARAVSHAGAQGLMQIMPGTARGLGVNPMNPAEAVDGAARLLSDYLGDYRGRVDLALAAYNAGPGAVRKYDGVPPYSETQNYIKRVTGYWKDLR